MTINYLWFLISMSMTAVSWANSDKLNVLRTQRVVQTAQRVIKSKLTTMNPVVCCHGDMVGYCRLCGRAPR